jgi:hypothetical protein
MADWRKITDEDLNPEESRIIAQRKGTPAQYKEIDWDGRLREIKRELDAIEKFQLNPFTIKPEKRKRLWEETAKKKRALEKERFAIHEAIKELRASHQKGKRKRKLK